MRLLMLSFYKKMGFSAIVASTMLMLSTYSHAGWEVTWIDRFDGSGVNWDNWTAQIQANYNNEIQCYTDDETSSNRNFEVSDGTLKITARKQTINCPGQNGVSRPWTSGRLNSKDKGEFLFGRVEARIRFLELRGGTWPAFWMLGNRIAEDPFKGDNDNVNWPNPGAEEIDIWEWYANNGDRYITNFFNTNNCGSEVRVPYPGGAPDVNDFHTYAIEWTADKIEFFMNGNMVSSQDMSNCPQYEEPMFVLINVAMGGTLGGNIDPTLNTATMEVDYVAHCAKTESNNALQCNESTPMMLDDDGDGVGNNLDDCPNTQAGALVDINGCRILTQPPTSAPTPTLPQNQVISLFSDAYTNISDIDYNPDWGQATQTTQQTIDGDNVLKYAGLNYQGTDFDNNKQDVSQMDYVHFDYWTHNATTLKFFIISPGPQETPFNVDIVQQQWQSIKVPLAHFTGVDLSNLFQLKVEGSGTVYLDNIYFSQEDTQQTEQDSDSDGVIDSADSCPNTPSGAQVDANGCAVEVNVAPQLNVQVMQNNQELTSTSILTNGGTVTLTASVSDDNLADVHSYIWNITNGVSFDENGNTISFDPSNISSAQISVETRVSDNGNPPLSATVTTSLNVTQAAVLPTPNPPAEESSGGSMGLVYLLGMLLLSFRRNTNCGAK